MNQARDIGASRVQTELSFLHYRLGSQMAPLANFPFFRLTFDALVVTLCRPTGAEVADGFISTWAVVHVNTRGKP